MSIREIAKKSLGGDHRISFEGKTFLKTADVLGRDLTIINFEMVTATKGASAGQVFACMEFREIEGGLYSGGVMLTKMLADIDADPVSVEELRHDGLPIRLTMAKTRAGKEFVRVEVL